MSVQKRTDIFNAPKRACKPFISGIDGSLDKRRKTALRQKRKMRAFVRTKMYLHKCTYVRPIVLKL